VLKDAFDVGASLIVELGFDSNSISVVRVCMDHDFSAVYGRYFQWMYRLKLKVQEVCVLTSTSFDFWAGMTRGAKVT